MLIIDHLVFIKEWLRSPKTVAAVAPSGTALAALITSGVSRNTGRVLELGPGTGLFTRTLIARGVDERDVTMIEIGPRFAHHLRRQFPQSSVWQMDAADLLTMPVTPGGQFGAVVCGLGFLNMTADAMEAILAGAFLHLRPGGAFFLFTYGARCSVPATVLSGLGLTATRVGKTYRNLPPATVYRLCRQAERA